MLISNALLLLALGVAEPNLIDTLPAPAAAMRPVIDSTLSLPRPVEYSDAYYTRLTIHRIGSYVMLPLFGAEYLIRQEKMCSRQVVISD